jgi:hypothetical protein
MSGQNCAGAKKFHERSAKAVWMTQIAGISRQKCTGSPPGDSTAEMPFNR